MINLYNNYCHDWLQDLHHEEPKSESTLRHYPATIRTLSSWMAHNGITPAKLKPKDVRAFQVYHYGETASRRSVAYVCGRGAQLYDWLIRRGVVKTNPFRHPDAAYRVGRMEKQGEYARRERRYDVGRQALERHLADPDETYRKALIGLDEWHYERERFLFEFLLNTGLRIGELRRAQIEHLHRHNRFLLVAVAKAGSRMVPLVMAQPALKRWLPHLRRRFGTRRPDIALYPREDGGCYRNECDIRRHLREILLVLGVDEKNVNAHILRHLFHARLQCELSPHVVSAITGNSVEVQLSHYSHGGLISPEAAEKALQRAFSG